MRVKKLHPDAKLPVRADDGSSGYDLFASEDVFVPVGGTEIIPTGIAIEMQLSHTIFTTGKSIPVFKIEDRSSMAIKGLRTGAGIVDYSYRGEIKVVMHNFNADNRTKEEIRRNVSGRGYKISKGDKIAQGIIYETWLENVEEVEELNLTERNDKGFGSSGAI